jgi:hypothetical protein
VEGRNEEGKIMSKMISNWEGINNKRDNDKGDDVKL